MASKIKKSIVESLENQTLSNLAAALYNFESDENIRKLIFDNLKNIEHFAELCIESPLTVMVGSNGTNKSTILKAIHGCVNGTSIGRYWFSTQTDPIKDLPRPEYTYIYNSLIYGIDLSVTQKRIKRKRTLAGGKVKYEPDYWEPQNPKGKAIKSLLSGRVPKIVKESLYINCKYEENQFERVILGKVDTKSKRRPQDFLRAASRSLTRYIQSGVVPKGTNKRELSNNPLSQDTINIINYILSQDYSSISRIYHPFFSGFSNSFIINKKGLKYSEALAGSGETIIMNLVSRIENCKDKSLIILDEPEFSLHPAAQKRLIEYLAFKCRYSGHQIFISTHSTHIVEMLNPESIRLLYNSNDKINIRTATSLEAFNNVGASFSNKPTIFVEDILAKRIIEQVAANSSKDFKDSFDVKVCPGGESQMMLSYMPRYYQSGQRAYFIADGDKNKNKEFKSSSDVLEKEYDEYLADILGSPPQFLIDSSKNVSSEVKEGLIDFIYHYIGYLPFNTPEEFIVKTYLEKNEFIKEISEEENYTTMDEYRKWKRILEEYARRDSGYIEGDSFTSKDIFNKQKELVKKIPKENEVFLKIKEMLDRIIKGDSLR